MKKGIAIVSIFLILFAVTFGVSAKGNEEILYQLGIVPQISENAENDIATRAEFAYSMSKLMNSADYKECNTAFDDVDESNNYSGYINALYNAGLVTGWDGRYEPDGGIKAIDAYSIILKYIGYDVFQKNYSAYADYAVSEASKLGLSRKVSVSGEGYITKKGLSTLMCNALEMTYIDTVYSQDGVKKISIMTDKRNIDSYKAIVEGVSDELNKATVRIISNYSVTNKNKQSSGAVLTYLVSNKVNISEYEGAPVIVYVYDNDKIVAAALQSNAEVIYEAVYAVNGDTDRTSSYIPSAVTTIATYEKNKKYNVAGDFKVKYNDSYVTTPVALAGKYARMVVVDNKITYIETWQLEEGGIIKAANPKEINYIRGSSKNAKLQFEDCNRIKVYINGEASNINHLKANTYFDYRYEKDDYIVIVASEKLISEELTSVDSDTLRIGDTEYDRCGTLYVAGVDGVFSKNSDVKRIMGNVVDAYFNCCEEIIYIQISKGDKTAYTSDFIGIINKCENKKRFEDGIIDETNLQIYMLDGDCEIHTFTINDKTIYDGVSKNDILNNIQKTDGSGIYLFEVSRSGKIRTIKNPLPYQLTRGRTARTKGTKGSFASDSNQSVIIDGKTVMFGSEDIVMIYEKDDNFIVSKVKASELQAKNVSPAVTLEFFGFDDTIDIRLITAYGTGLGDMYNYLQNFGIIEHKKVVYDDIEEVTKCQYDLISTAGNTITLSESKAVGIPKTAFVRFNTLINKGIDSAKIDSAYTVDLSKPVSEWAGDILKQGRISQINSKAIMLDNGEVYFLNTKHLSVFEYKDKEFSVTDIDDVRDGDRVYYHMSTYDGIEAICAVIVVR